MRTPEAHAPLRDLDVAIVGMAGRFPGARNLDEFWRNLRDGVESIQFFSTEELRERGVGPELLARPDYVRAASLLEGIEEFDARLFGMSPREAELLDPQHRFLLECVWEGLEDSGYDPERFAGAIGVFAGASLSGYMVNAYSGSRPASPLEILLGNDKDYLATRVSYKLNLRGPSLAVQTACSTSLVAVHLACQSLLAGDCDIAVAGGVAVKARNTGYLHFPGEPFSPDGHTRAFDARGQGTLFGNGVGVVVLKRLGEALADGDTVRAVIRGSAVNNDGSLRVGYTAPRMDGQVRVVADALEMAEVEPESVTYVEAHGTGTSLGDPIEVAALNRVFRAATGRRRFCPIGSVKTNVGHLETAAGVAGLIKTVLALQHGQIPPSLNFEEPNPEIDFDDSPFYVNTRLADWPAGDGPRRAGVSSFGMGGTNAHVILEEAPAAQPSGPSRPAHLLLLSARTPEALDNVTDRLADHLVQHPEQDLADIACTLQVGRKALGHRRALVCRDRDDALKALRERSAQRLWTRHTKPGDRPVVFLFPGNGTQHAGMGQGLYAAETVFRREVDTCLEILAPHLEGDLRAALDPASADGGGELLRRPLVSQPALFITEYALARLWMSWGIQPRAMIGHSIGEYMAACLAGVMSLEDALALVVLRGRLFEKLPRGAMLSVSLPEREVLSLLRGRLSLAAVNEAARCVVSGPGEEVEQLERSLAIQGLEARRVPFEVATHSSLVDSVLGELGDFLQRIRLHQPQIPFISGVTGTWIGEEAVDSAYWVRHLRQTVRFADGLTRLLEEPSQVFLEVGPGHILSACARRHPLWSAERTALPSLPHPQDPRPELPFLLETLGRLWLAGLAPDWDGFHADERRCRVALPTYPFERKRHWIDPVVSALRDERRPGRAAELADWFYVPVWRQSVSPLCRGAAGPPETGGHWLLLGGEQAFASALAGKLAQAGLRVTTVIAGQRFGRIGPGSYTLTPDRPEDYGSLLRELREAGELPREILHLWALGRLEGAGDDRGFSSLLGLARALAEHGNGRSPRITIIADGLWKIGPLERPRPEQALLLGPARVIPLEYPGVACRTLDIVPPESGDGLDHAVCELLAELAADPAEEVVAYRDGQRWIRHFEAVRLRGREGIGARLRPGGVYLITGGLGRAGLALAGLLARTVQARLVLTGRTGLPERGRRGDALSPEGGETVRRIRGIEALEEAGSEVLVLAADVTDEEQMREVVRQAQQRFGALHGVIHCAALPGGAPIREETRHGAEAVMAPKIRGARVLASVLEGLHLDFFVLLAATRSLTGWSGQVANCAADAALDAFACAAGRPLIAVAMDSWNPSEGAPALSSEAGTEAFRRALDLSGIPQVVVSADDLTTRMEEQRQPGPVRKEDPEDLEMATDADSSRLPEGQVGRLVATSWQEILGGGLPAPNDHFFELGGDSLIGTKLLSRLRQIFGVELQPRLLFEAPTLGELTARVEAALGQGRTGGMAPLERVKASAAEERLPLSFAQQRLWLAVQLQPESGAYNVPGAFNATGPLDAGLLARALDGVVRRHEVLRARFAESGGEPFLVIAPAVDPLLSLIDLSGLPAAQRDLVAGRIVEREVRRPFDLSRAGLLRVSLLRLDLQRHILLCVVHHIASDAWSMQILADEVTALYKAFAAGEPSPLPELPIQYADFAAWQRRWLDGEALADLLGYWCHQLGGELPVLELPFARPRPERPTYRGGQIGFSLSQELTASLKDLGQQRGCTLFMTLLAGLFALLYRSSGQTDLIVGTEVAGRTRVELEPLIGFFINLLALRGRPHGQQTFAEFLDQVCEVSLEAYSHQGLPFEKLIEELAPQRLGALTNLLQTVFVLENIEMRAVDLGAVRLDALPLGSDTCKFDLLLIMYETPGGLTGIWTYSRDLFAEADMEQLSKAFAALLENAAKEPETRLDKLEMRTGSEKERHDMDRKEKQMERRRGLADFRPRAVTVSRQALIQTRYLTPDGRLPLVVEPAVPGLDLVDWARENAAFVESELLRHGAVLFRCNVPSAAEFERFCQVFCPELYDEYGDLPRERIGERIYESTPYAADQAILFHNESSQMHCWPLKQWFFCMQPAAHMGETPIADGRRIYQLLAPELREELARKGLLYVRNFNPGLDVPWQEFFRTADRSEVEGYCRRSGIACEWTADGGLRTRIHCPAVARHPKTGESVFFNQIQAHHISCLEPEVRASLLSLFALEDLPRNVYYGDGSPIPDSTVLEVRRIYDEIAVSFPWQKGDILMVDNMLVAHSRNPYEGPRKILVSMGEMVASKDVALDMDLGRFEAVTQGV